MPDRRKFLSACLGLLLPPRAPFGSAPLQRVVVRWSESFEWKSLAPADAALLEAFLQKLRAQRSVSNRLVVGR